MAKTKILLVLALDYFTRYPESQECHITSDNRIFHQQSTADSFALSLKDNTVESFTREEVVSGTEVVGATGAEDDAPITLETFDPETSDYGKAKELFKTLGLTAASNSKVDIFAALSAAKTANSQT
jgi:hypothetical protein